MREIMKKKVCAATLCGLLALSGPCPFLVDAEIPDIPQEEARSEAADLDVIIQAVKEAIKQETPDIQSDAIQNFLAAFRAYDQMEEADKNRLPEETLAGMETVQERIGEAIHSCEGVSVGGEWYIQTNATDGEDWEAVQELLKKNYEGASPRLAYYKNIRYTNLLTGEPCLPDYGISLLFPIPQEYHRMTNPQIFTMMDGTLLNISPEQDGLGHFCIQRAGFLTNVIVVDLPIALQGISLEAEAGVNAGQQIVLHPAPFPSNTTESYEVDWSSSDPGVAQVDAQGMVTGKKTGTAEITAVVKGSGFTASCRVTVVQGTQGLETSVDQVMEETKAHMLSIDKSPTVGSEWFVIGLARSGLDLGDSYFATFYNHYANYLEENKGVLTNNKYTEYSKAIVTMTAIGKDARDIAGYNLFEPLADFEQVKAQGINGPIWALIALHTNPEYSIPQVSGVNEQTTEEGLVAYILGQECPGGGWNLVGGSGEPDMTGMALQALAPYYQRDGYADVTAAVDRALAYLSAAQNPTGGFSTSGSETMESCVQVLTGLCALGIDPEQDERFIKGGHWLVENLLSYHIAGSGFMHVKPGVDANGGGEGGELNGMSTEQGYYAMTAYQRLKTGQTSLYDMSDLAVKGGEKGDGNGTGLVVPTPKPPGNGNSGTPAPTTPARPSPGSVAGTNPNAAIGTATGNTIPNTAGTGTPAPASRPVSTNRTPTGTTPTTTYSTATRTASAPTATPALIRSTPASRNTVSSNQKSSTKKTKNTENTQEESSGWNFEGAVYEEDTDGWDFEGEETTEPADAEEVVAAIQELLDDAQTERKPQKKSLPPLGVGAAGGFLGAAALEGGRHLLNKKKGRKRL